jgi:hypothetical protein
MDITCKQCGKNFNGHKNRIVCSPSCRAYYVGFAGRKHEDPKKLRRSEAWQHADSILEKYQNGSTIQWLVREYKADKKTIRLILKEKGITQFRGRAGIPAWNKGKEIPSIQGKNSPHWKGGVTPLNMKVRRCAQYRNWRTEVFERDNWTCQMCGKRGGNLEADHYPIPFAEIMITLKSFREAKDSEKLWSISNARTLCVPCHNTTKKSSSNCSNNKVKRRLMQ